MGYLYGDANRWCAGIEPEQAREARVYLDRHWIVVVGVGRQRVVLSVWLLLVRFVCVRRANRALPFGQDRSPIRNLYGFMV